MKSEEYKKLKSIVNKKTSKIKIEVDELQIKLDELDELVEEKTRKVIKRKLIKQVIEAIQTDLEALERRMLDKVASGYYEYIRTQTDAIIKTEFKKGINFKHKVIHGDVAHSHDTMGMMNNGWRLIYIGPLQYEAGKRKDVFIFEKPVKRKLEAKVELITENNYKIKKKAKKTKKVNRKPV